MRLLKANNTVCFFVKQLFLEKVGKHTFPVLRIMTPAKKAPITEPKMPGRRRIPA